MHQCLSLEAQLIWQWSLEQRGTKAVKEHTYNSICKGSCSAAVNLVMKAVGSPLPQILTTASPMSSSPTLLASTTDAAPWSTSTFSRPQALMHIKPWTTLPSGHHAHIPYSPCSPAAPTSLTLLQKILSSATCHLQTFCGQVCEQWRLRGYEHWAVPLVHLDNHSNQWCWARKMPLRGLILNVKKQPMPWDALRICVREAWSW